MIKHSTLVGARLKSMPFSLAWKFFFQKTLDKV